MTSILKSDLPFSILHTQILEREGGMGMSVFAPLLSSPKMDGSDLRDIHVDPTWEANRSELLALCSQSLGCEESCGISIRGCHWGELGDVDNKLRKIRKKSLVRGLAPRSQMDFKSCLYSIQVEYH